MYKWNAASASGRRWLAIPPGCQNVCISKRLVHEHVKQHDLVQLKEWMTGWLRHSVLPKRCWNAAMAENDPQVIPLKWPTRGLLNSPRKRPPKGGHFWNEITSCPANGEAHLKRRAHGFIRISAPKLQVRPQTHPDVFQYPCYCWR